MKRLFLVLMVALLAALLFSGCECKHEWLTPTGEFCGLENTCRLCGETDGKPRPPHNWSDATCSQPRTCSLCGATQGEPLGHHFKDATCQAPEICMTCGMEQGEPLEHNWQAATCKGPKWCPDCGASEGEALEHPFAAATCTAPKICLDCGLTEGAPLGHDWLEATLEAPQTCSRCGATEGSKLPSDSRFDADACQALFGTWEGKYIMTGEMMGDPSIPAMDMILRITFFDDGTYQEGARMEDEAAYQLLLEEYYITALYQEFELQGFDQAQADALMLEAYGMDISTYAKVMAAAVDWTELFSSISGKGVYYVADNVLYSGESWSSELMGDAFTLVGDTLSVEGMVEEGVTFVLKKVS